MLSCQHDTVFDLSQVPSNPDASMEMRLVFTAFAAQGYIVIGADYFGCGQSDLPDSYLVRQSTHLANLDMLLRFLGTGVSKTSLYFNATIDYPIWR